MPLSIVQLGLPYLLMKQKRGLDTSFAHEAIRRCGVFHGLNKYPRTDDLSEFASAFANQDVIDAFEMEIKKIAMNISI